MNPRLVVFSALCLCLAQSSASQSHELIEGVTIKVSGIVKLVQQGNNRYLVIRPDSTYEAVFDASDHRKVRQVGLSLADQWEALRSIVGKKVVVEGKVQLEPLSPYYLNGTLILADSIAVNNSVILRPKKYVSHPVSATIPQFRAVVTFSPRKWDQFSYEALDEHGRKLPSLHDYLSCRLNGPGDVMNCYCADGFAFSGMAEGNTRGFSKLKTPPSGFDFAQFVINEDGRHTIREEVRCTRETPHPEK